MQTGSLAGKAGVEKGVEGGSPRRRKRERPRHEGEGGVSAPWSGSGLVQADSGRRGDPERKDQRRDEADADGGHFFRSLRRSRAAAREIRVRAQGTRQTRRGAVLRGPR